MANNLKLLRNRHRGYTLVEVMVAITLLVVGIMALAAIIVPLSRQREQVEAKFLVLERARSLLEEISGIAPENIASTYNGKTYIVSHVSGANADGTAIAVSVDSTNPKLVLVTVTGAWTLGGHTETLSLQTASYSPQGQR